MINKKIKFISVIVIFIIVISFFFFQNVKRAHIIVVEGGIPEVLITDIQPWHATVNDYVGNYGFGFSETESELILTNDNNVLNASIKSGKFNENATEWITSITTLNNIKIEGNKFYSDKWNGEFVSFIVDNKKEYGLKLYRYVKSDIGKPIIDEIGFYSSIQNNTETENSNILSNQNKDFKNENRPTASWDSYTYENFKILFPSEPKITNSLPPIPNINKINSITTYATIDETGATYFITVTDFLSNTVKDSQQLLKNTILDTVNNLQGKLAGAIDTSNDTGLSSLDFVIDISDGPRTYMGRNVFQNNKLYEMRVVYLDSKSAEFRKFVDSLQIK